MFEVVYLLSPSWSDFPPLKVRDIFEIVFFYRKRKTSEFVDFFLQCQFFRTGIATYFFNRSEQTYQGCFFRNPLNNTYFIRENLAASNAHTSFSIGAPSFVVFTAPIYRDAVLWRRLESSFRGCMSNIDIEKVFFFSNFQRYFLMPICSNFHVTRTLVLMLLYKALNFQTSVH